jgi:hypothetical protein
MTLKILVSLVGTALSADPTPIRAIMAILATMVRMIWDYEEIEAAAAVVVWLEGTTFPHPRRLLLLTMMWMILVPTMMQL